MHLLTLASRKTGKEREEVKVPLFDKYKMIVTCRSTLNSSCPFLDIHTNLQLSKLALGEPMPCV